jgi:hypothetical protein
VDCHGARAVLGDSCGWIEYGQTPPETLGKELMIFLYARAIFGVFILTVAAFGAGFWIEKRLPESFTALERVAFQCLAGLGTFSIALFLIGQIAFTGEMIGMGAAAAVVLGIAPLRRVLKTPATGWKLQMDSAAAAVIVAVLLVTAVGGLAEITGDWENDAIAYHLLGPKVWLRNGIILPVPDNCHTAFPAVAEVFYGALTLLGGNRAPGFSAVISLALFLIVSYSMAMRAGLESRKAWWVAALLAAMPAVYAGAHGAFVDVLYASFLLAAVSVGLQKGFAGHGLVFGSFCGLAMGTKYTGVMAFPVLIATAAIFTRRNNEFSWRETLARSGKAALVGILVALPFYLRNWLVLGSPIYPPPPILSKIFPVKYLSEASIASFHSYIFQRGAGLGRGWSAFLDLPFNLTYHTSNFHGAGGIGLLPLALGPFGVLATWKDGFGRALAILGMALTILWFFTQQESRFLIPVYAIGGIFGVLGWQYVRAAAPRHTRVLCCAVIGSSLAYGLFMIVCGSRTELKAAVSSTFAEKYRQDSIPFLASFQYLNAEPSVKRVLVLDRSVPVYYLDRNYLKPFGQWGEQVLPDISQPAQVLAKLPSLHVTHILDVSSVVGDFQVPASSPDLQLVFEDLKQRVYRVR